MKEDEAAIVREKEKCYLELSKDSGVGMVNSIEKDQSDNDSRYFDDEEGKDTDPEFLAATQGI